jgi:hypothetical protein
MTLDDIKARCEEVGDCWIWQGAKDGHGRPQARHQGKVVYVRRLARELADGKPMPPNLVAASKCGDPGCVSPECSVRTTTKGKAKLAAARGAYSDPAKIARTMLTRRAQSRIPDALVEQIRLAPGPCVRIAAETNVSVSHVKAIRRGAARRPISSPFAGLGAR